jgi:RNA polymerase sigma-70 factor (ECF subfamily)
MHGAGLMDDAECIARYLEGDVEAMETMVERHRRALYCFALAMTGRNADADEVFQETWFRALRALSRYRERNFRGWLLRIARNVFIDRVRKKKPERSIFEEDPDGVPMERVLSSPEPAPDARAADSEIGRRIGTAVARLPAEQREVFVLRMWSGVTFREIAVLQRTSINTALARMQYALKKLRQELRDDYLALAETEMRGMER